MDIPTEDRKDVDMDGCATDAAAILPQVNDSW